jgi:hypothetical protein
VIGEGVGGPEIAAELAEAGSEATRTGKPARRFKDFTGPRSTVGAGPAASSPRPNGSPASLQRVDEESGRGTIATRPKPITIGLTTRKIDLGRVLSHDNPTADTGRNGSCCDRLHHLPARYRRCRQKTVNRKLASPILTKRPDDQRPCRHHPLDQFRPNRRPARIAEIPKFPDRTQNGISLQEMPPRFNILQFGQMNCVNAVGS